MKAFCLFGINLAEVRMLMNFDNPNKNEKDISAINTYCYNNIC